MLDKTQDVSVTEKDLGVGIRFACTVGSGRQIEMTAGIPLDWDVEKMNGILDRLAITMNRQALKYQLHDMKLALEQAERQLETTRQQVGNYEQTAMAEWERGGRKGAFRASESQTKQIQNYKNSEGLLIENIKKLRRDIKDTEEQCR